MARTSAPIGDRERAMGEKLRRARVKAGLSQAELGERIDVSQDIITNLESARSHMRVGQLLDLADALKVKPASLLP